MPRLSKIGAACLSAFGFGTGSSGVSVEVLIIAGGGGGGAAGGSLEGGGGGAGGVLYHSGKSLSLSSSYTVVIGAGAAGGATGVNQGTLGSNSSFDTLTAIGGGGGGAGYASTQALANGLSGGSGGGGGNTTNSSTGNGGTSTQTSSGGATGYGSSGGTGFHTPGFAAAGGGGGGAGAAGSNANTSTGAGGNGGNGLSTWSSWAAATGTGHNVSGTYYYAGGGGGAGNYLQYSSGGYGGGATSGSGGNAAQAPNAMANTGGGGGGGPVYTGAGGSGLTIVRYLGAQKFGGGIVSSDGTYTYHTFKTSGQLVPMTPITASYLIVAGGGGGGTQSAGGGGAGGLLTGSTLSIDTSSTYVVTVGAGGAGAPAGTSGACAAGSNGTSSSFSLVSTTAIGGGGSGSYRVAGGLAGATGGSGGGGAIPTGAGGAGTSGQGYAGGQGGTDSNNNLDVGGGGGGAGAAGVSYNDANTAIRGDGGVGVQSSISGTATYYAGGGGGATHNGTRPGTGGLGGGGNGAATNANGANGTANTGGGAGGGSEWSNTGGTGGSGVVIIAYAGTTQLMAGGTVTIIGGNVIHTFTSSGYLTPLTFVGRSLRFRSSASASISRTNTVTGNRKTWTFSTWLKRGSLAATSQEIIRSYSNTNDTTTFIFTNDTLYFTCSSGGTETAKLATSQVFRDPAAWYHVVLAIDTTQATASNRLKMYVTGTQVTAFSSTTYPTQNADLTFNGANIHRIGQGDYPGYPQNFDGYMADIRFIDGQQLTPNSFGTFNSYGVWQPINYGGSYGTNGFYLPFSDTTSTTTLCYDQGPQGNNWTANNISLTAGSTYDSMTDVPTLTSATAANYAVWNPLDNASGLTITNANLATSRATTSWASTRSSIGMTTGKWYWEVTPTSGIVAGSLTNQIMIGLSKSDAASTGFYQSATGWGYYFYDGNKFNNNSGSAYGATYANNDVIGVAFDADNGTLTFYKNNTSQGTAYTGLTSGPYFAAVGHYGTSGAAINFGQQPFQYTPPSGFVALNTYNL